MKSKNKTNNNNENQNSGNVIPAAGVNVAPALGANIAPVERRRRGRPTIPDPNAYENHCEEQRILEKFKPLAERTTGYERWIFRGLVAAVEIAIEGKEDFTELHEYLTDSIQRCREIQPEFAFYLHFLYDFDEKIFREASADRFAKFMILLFCLKKNKPFMSKLRALQAETQPGSGAQSLAKS